MKKVIICLTLMVIYISFSNCSKNNAKPAAPSPPQSTNSTPPASQTPTLSATECSVACKWYYEKSEIISNGSVSPGSGYQYTLTPAYNTIEFKSVMASVSTQTNLAYPLYKEMVKVLNGVTYNNLVWKINDQGILIMGISGNPAALIDSLTSTRLVITEYGSLQPLNGTRYYLHK